MSLVVAARRPWPIITTIPCHRIFFSIQRLRKYLELDTYSQNYQNISYHTDEGVHDIDHKVTAVGSRSIESARAFVGKLMDDRSSFMPVTVS